MTNAIEHHEEIKNRRIKGGRGGDIECSSNVMINRTDDKRRFHELFRGCKVFIF